MKTPFSPREKLLLSLLSVSLIFSSFSFSYAIVSQSRVDSIMKIITDGGAKFSDVPVSGQTKSERTQYYEKVDAGLGDAVEMLAVVRNNIRSLLGLSPAYTADDIVGSILGGVIGGVGGSTGTTSGTGTRVGTGVTSGTGGTTSTTGGNQKYSDVKLCTNFPNGMRYFIVYREISTTQSLTQDVMYNTQDILSGATIRSLSPTATDAQKKAFITADPLNTYIFKGWGTTDDVLRSNMKGTTANSTYRSGDKAIFIRYIDDYEGERLQCTAPVKSVADSQKDGVFVKKMYRLPEADRSDSSKNIGIKKYNFDASGQKCIKTLDELRRINPDTVGPNNPKGYQYTSYKNAFGDCYFNVVDHAKYKSGAFGADDIPDTCKIGEHFVNTYNLSECVSKDYAYGIPLASPDCQDNRTSQTAVFDATQMIGRGTPVKYADTANPSVLYTKTAGENAPEPVMAVRFDLKSKPWNQYVMNTDYHPYEHQLSELGGNWQKVFLVTLSPCLGDFTSPEAHIITGIYTNGIFAGGMQAYQLYTSPPGSFASFMKLSANIPFFQMPNNGGMHANETVRMQNGGVWYVNTQSLWCPKTGSYEFCTNKDIVTQQQMSIPGYTLGLVDSGSVRTSGGNISSMDVPMTITEWKNIWQLPSGSSLIHILSALESGGW